MRVIGQDEYANTMEEYLAALRTILPIVGFSPEEVAAEIEGNAQLGRNWLLRIETAGGQTAFATMRKHADGWILHSLIPSVWEDRYTILREAIAQIRTAFLEQCSGGASFISA